MAANTWNFETKSRLSDKVTSNMSDIASLTKQIIRGSKCNEVRYKCIVQHSYFSNIQISSYKYFFS